MAWVSMVGPETYFLHWKRVKAKERISPANGLYCCLMVFDFTMFGALQLLDNGT